MRRSVRRGWGARIVEAGAAVLCGLLLCLAASACASTPEGRGGGPDGEEEAVEALLRETVTVRIDNQNFKDASIYAYWDGARIRVGTVVGKSVETFEMDWRGNRIVFEVDFVAGDRYRTSPMDVSRGDDLKLIIGIN